MCSSLRIGLSIVPRASIWGSVPRYVASSSNTPIATPALAMSLHAFWWARSRFSSIGGPVQSGALPCPKIPGSHVASAKPRELSTWLRAREKRLIVPEMMSAWRPGLSVIAVLWPCEVPDVRTQQNLPTAASRERF